MLSAVVADLRQKSEQPLLLEHQRDKLALEYQDQSDVEDKTTQKSKVAALVIALSTAVAAGDNKLDCPSHGVKVGMEIRILTLDRRYSLVFIVVKLGSIYASVAMGRDYPVKSIITQVISADDPLPPEGPRTDDLLISDIESIVGDKTKYRGDAKKAEIPILPQCRAEIDMFGSNLKQACRAVVTMETKDRLFTVIAKARVLPKESDRLYRIPSALDFVENAIFTALQRLSPRSRS